MDRLSDDDLFTSPLTFMGAPYGRPGPTNKAAILGHPVRLRHQHADRRARRPRLGAPAIGADAPLQSRPMPTSIRSRRSGWSIAATSS